MSDDGLLESLFYRSEDPSVEFKGKQYVFSRSDVHATALSPAKIAEKFEKEKSELLKDVLALANAWRDGPAYIVIGAVENKPDRPRVVGLNAAHLHDDAKFQQYINSKVNRRIDFKYELRRYQGKVLALITIPKQRRPFFAKKDYGGVRGGVVYVRGGSSTAIADADEIAAMGGENLVAKPRIALTLLGQDNRQIAGTTREIRVIAFPAAGTLPNFSHDSGAMHDVFSSVKANFDYWRHLAHFLAFELRAIRVRIELQNQSEFALTSAEVHVRVQMSSGKASIVDSSDLPTRPQAYSNRFENYALIRDHLPKIAAPLAKTSLTVDYQEKVAKTTFLKVLPGAVQKGEEFFAVLPENSGTLTLECTLYATELKEPMTFITTVEVNASIEKGTIKTLEKEDKE